MTLIRFLKSDGSLDREVEVAAGENLLYAAQDHGQPLEGTCDGQMACATCHVHLTAEDFAALPRPSEEEEEMLDLTPGAGPTSRLACQVTVAGERMTVRVG